MDGRHYVGYVGTLRDQTRLAIDHGIVDFALFLVFLGGRFNQITAELTLEFIDIFLLHVFLSFLYSGGANEVRRLFRFVVGARAASSIG
jgi:hypothetical protein